MKKKNKNIRAIKLYVQWPILFSVLMLIINLVVVLCDIKIGITIAPCCIAYIVMLLIMYYQRTARFHSVVVKYATNYDKIQNRLLKNLDVPYAILDYEGALLWGNQFFMDIVENEKAAKRSILNIFSDIRASEFPKDKMVEKHVIYKDVSYKIVMRRIFVSELFDKEDKDVLASLDDKKNSLIAMYLYDETEIKRYEKENKEQRIVVGLIDIDNYEEVFESVDETKKVVISALVERKITKYMQNMGGIIKRLEKDKYIVILKRKDLKKLQEKKFSILEEVRSITIGNDMSLTLSIGIGVDEDTLLVAYEAARAAMDLALGRGGDQVAIKENGNVTYFGGKNSKVEKNTKVKSRVKAHALKEIFIAKDDVMVMGHTIGDLDCFGASVGIYRIAKTLQKRVHIVLDKPSESVKPFMNRFINNDDYEDDMFISEDEALDMITPNTVLVVVDVSRPSYTECPKLLEKAKTVMVIDHHRQSGDVIDNMVISYIDPYSSSACEMVVEVMQYVDDKLKIKSLESDAMYAGIIVDTNNFVTKTGVRTFEAAAYLRKNGADLIKIRKDLRTDLKDYSAKAEAIKNVEIFLDQFAITACDTKGLSSPTTVGAQIADELLNIAGIKASFVITPYNNKLYISARSIDEVNVQLIMEKFGGGGHMTVAGAQIEDKSEDEARSMIKMKVAEMLSNDEI